MGSNVRKIELVLKIRKLNHAGPGNFNLIMLMMGGNQV